MTEAEAILSIGMLVPTEWPMLREARLRALRESPHAFTSQFPVEREWDDRQWQRLLASGTWVVATEIQDVVGIAALVDAPHMPYARHIESVWVAPPHRHRGVLRSLLATMVRISRRVDVSVLLLWVLEDNTIAQRAYARLGFVPTGERQPIRPGDDRHEVRMRLLL